MKNKAKEKIYKIGWCYKHTRTKDIYMLSSTGHYKANLINLRNGECFGGSSSVSTKFHHLSKPEFEFLTLPRDRGLFKRVARKTVKANTIKNEEKRT